MSDLDTSSLSTTLKRYAQVTSTVGSVAWKVLAERFLGADIDKKEHAEALRAILGDLKGPLMKVAQILATVPGMVPDEYVHEFLHLQSHAPSMGWFFVKRRMAAELGPDWQDHFSAFDQHASFAASLGQVHRAKTQEGTEVACKLQYPDMATTVATDLSQFKALLSLYKGTMKAVDTDEIYNEIKLRLYEELDYRLEANHIRMFQEVLAGEAQIRVPTVHTPLSTERLLSMSWLEGQRFEAVKPLAQETRNKVAKLMFRAWYYPFYHAGLIHGDPHLGNYSFVLDNDDVSAINLMDFGCVRQFSGTFVQGVIDLYHALNTGDEARAVHAYEQWGFKPVTKELVTTLNLWAHYLYGPLLDDRVRLIDETLSGDEGRKIAGKIHHDLRQMGGIKPPREFVFMDRAAVGLGSVFIHLKAKLNWYQAFHELIEGFNAKTLDHYQAEVKQKVNYDA